MFRPGSLYPMTSANRGRDPWLNTRERPEHLKAAQTFNFPKNEVPRRHANVGPTLNNGCPFRWPNIDIQRWPNVSLLVGPICRHYVGPTHVNVNYNVGPTLALHNFNVGQTQKLCMMPTDFCQINK